MKKFLAFLAAVALLMALSACGSNQNAASGTNVKNEADPNAQQVKIIATNWKFDQAEYKVKKGTPVTISLDLKQGMHNAVIPQFNIKLDSNKQTVTFTPNKAGTYDIRCMIPCGQGHDSMVSKLVVE